MEYPTQPSFPTHKECVNFRNGFCTLSGVAVDPNGAACPRFTPKSMTGMSQTVRKYPEIQQSHYQPPTPLPSHPSWHPAQPFYYPPSYVPHLWGIYYHPVHPMYPWNPHGYRMIPWYSIPLSHLGCQLYYAFPPPFQMPPRSPDEELKMLEDYRRELQAEINSLDARIRELRRWVKGL